MRGLYAIIDLETLERRGLSPVPFAERVFAARPAAVQIRDKRGGARLTLALLRELLPLAEREAVPLFANDRPDLALLAGCDGVHVGQEDLPPALVRALAARTVRERTLRIGLSTHDAAQLEAALGEPIDYVAIGPIFPTASKDNPSPVLGIEALGELSARVRARRPGLPIVAIGGISLETAEAVGRLVDAVAVIGALVPAEGEDVTARARALHLAILGEGR